MRVMAPTSPATTEAIQAALAARDLLPKDPYNLYSVAQQLAQCVPLIGKGSKPLSAAVLSLEFFVADFDATSNPEKTLATLHFVRGLSRPK